MITRVFEDIHCRDILKAYANNCREIYSVQIHVLTNKIHWISITACKAELATLVLYVELITENVFCCLARRDIYSHFEIKFIYKCRLAIIGLLVEPLFTTEKNVIKAI